MYWKYYLDLGLLVQFQKNLDIINMFFYKKLKLKQNCAIQDALQSIYGIGNYKSLLMCIKFGLAYPFSINNLNVYLVGVFRFILDEYTWLDARIKRIISQNIKKLLEIGCYRGQRHFLKLPCRGQRTRTNAKTCKKKKN
jgi:small subunit ribosomal protein S13